jgi:hypothetical protein
VRDSRGLLLLLVLVVATAIAVWLLTRREPEPLTPQPPAETPDTVRLEFDDIPVDSPDLAVGPARIRSAVQEGFSSWLVIVECTEPGGCAGELAVDVELDTGAGRDHVVLAGRVDVAAGDEMRFEGLQDPSTPVEAIDGVTLEVRHRGAERDLISEPIQ